jgi:hypothetical protein
MFDFWNLESHPSGMEGLVSALEGTPPNLWAHDAGGFRSPGGARPKFMAGDAGAV